MLRPVRHRNALLHRLLAASAAALVFALGVFAASPALHEWLHSHDAPPANDSCAIVLFANGVSTPLGMLVLTPPAAVWGESVRPIAREIFLASPRYLRLPERGPPQLG